MSRGRLVLLSVLLCLAAVADLRLRLWVSEPAPGSLLPERNAAAVQALPGSPGLASPFDPFYGSSAATMAVRTEGGTGDQNSAAPDYHYHLFAITAGADGRAVALIAAEPGPASKPQALGEGETIGDARVLAIETHTVLIESASQGEQTLTLFQTSKTP